MHLMQRGSNGRSLRPTQAQPRDQERCVVWKCASARVCVYNSAAALVNLIDCTAPTWASAAPTLTAAHERSR